MTNITNETLHPARKLKTQAEDWRELMEAYDSMRGEDVSDLSFGHSIPREKNELLVEFANRFQAAMAPIEGLRQQILDAIQESVPAELGTAANAGPATSFGSTEVTDGGPFLDGVTTNIVPFPQGPK